VSSALSIELRPGFCPVSMSSWPMSVVDGLFGDIASCGDVGDVRPDFNRSSTFRGGIRVDSVGASWTCLGASMPEVKQTSSGNSGYITY
jgi:hypothetical protein